MKSCLAALGLAFVVFYFVQRFPQMQKGMDFADFYAAARIVRDGRGAQLYDPSTQDVYLARYAGRTGTQFIHPPFETLLFVPLTYMPLTTAYGIWCAINAVLLSIAAILLSREVGLPVSWQLLVLVCLAFVPVLLNFMQGQDAILLLFFFVLAYRAAACGHEFISGTLLACGLIKFHLAIPLFIPLAIVYSKKLVAGFVAGALTLVVVSAMVCGWAGLISYPQFLAQLPGIPLSGLHFEAMANLRGLVTLGLPGRTTASFWIILLSSIAVLGLAIHAAVVAKKSGNRKMLWSVAVLSAALVSYHLSPHDLTILLLPICFIVEHLKLQSDVPRPNRWLAITLVAALLLPPLHLILLAHHDYAPIGILVLLLFLFTYAEARRSSKTSLPRHAA